MTAAERPKIGLAVSGGGFRATAFGLGALRALHDRGILNDVAVVSGISGGSLLTAMWAYGPEDFNEFDDTVTELLRKGLQWELVRRAFMPHRAALNVGSALGATLPSRLRRNRTGTRTEVLVDALRSRGFGARNMNEVAHAGLDTIITATDLATGNAVRFGSDGSACSPHGVIAEDVRVADAVAASAAFPAILPQLNRTYTFTRQGDQSQHRKTVLMTDGGVYDNLGLSALLPGRSKKFTHHAYELPYLIAIDAGAGRTTSRAPNFLLGRMKRSFEIAHTRAQDGTRARIHEAGQAGTIQGFVYAYLGMNDQRLPVPLADLVPREQVSSYPTNFKSVTSENIDALTTRGEQLTRLLVTQYCPDLGR